MAKITDKYVTGASLFGEVPHGKIIIECEPRELHALSDALEAWLMGQTCWYGQPAKPRIKKVIFNPPATIVFWSDGTKTVVKAQETVADLAFGVQFKMKEFYNPEVGLAMAIAKKALGNKGSYYNEFKKWLKGEDDR